MNLFNNAETTEQAVATGHEAFIHIDSYDDRLISAVEKNDKRGIGNIVKERRLIRDDRQGGPDHDAYLDKERTRMNSYLTQLKGILNPTRVAEEEKRHNGALEKDRKPIK